MQGEECANLGSRVIRLELRMELEDVADLVVAHCLHAFVPNLGIELRLGNPADEEVEVVWQPCP